MRSPRHAPRSLALAASMLALAASPAAAQWVTRDAIWPPRGPWRYAVPRELPQLYREFNGIDFGHAHLAETLLHTQDQGDVERARLEVVAFIFSSPRVPPDETQVAPSLSRLVWEVERAFDWAHEFHRSLYDVFAADRVTDKEAAYRKLLANYLDKPVAITSHRLDHHGKLWGFPESRSFSGKFPKFNTQIWAYHWLQGATYDVQLGRSATEQRELLRKLIEHYHGYIVEPPVEWEFMPMLMEGSPQFAERFPEAAAVFDNLHMLHDNIDDVLTSLERFPTPAAKRERILELLSYYLHRNHVPEDRFAEFHAPEFHMMMPGPRPPTAQEVIAAPRVKEPGGMKPGGKEPGGMEPDSKEPKGEEPKGGGHGGHGGRS